MKKLINYLFSFATSNKGVADVKNSPRHGFYGVNFRNLDWVQVKSNLSTIESMIPKNLTAKLSMAGDTYKDRGIEKTVQDTFLWISKDLREDQTPESVLKDIPDDLL